MSKIKTNLLASDPIRRTPTGDHLHVISAPGDLTIVAELRGEKTRSYQLSVGEGQRTGPFDSLQIHCAVAGPINVAATIGEFIPARNEVTAKIDPDNNSVSMAETVSVSIDEIGITTAKNTIKIDPLNNAVDIDGQTVDIAGQVVNITGQTVDIDGQSVNISGQTVDVSGQTVDVSGQTVDVSGQEIKSAPAKTYGEQVTALVVDTTVKVANTNANRKNAVFSAESDGRLWLDNTASATKGIPYTAGKLYLIDCEDELFFHPLTGGINAYLLE